MSYKQRSANWEDRQHVGVQRADIERMKAKNADVDDEESFEDVEEVDDEESQDSDSPPSINPLNAVVLGGAMGSAMRR